MNDKKPDGREVKATIARAYGPDCIGCLKHDAAAMLSFIEEGKPTTEQFVDVFLDRKQAEELHAELGKRLGL